MSERSNFSLFVDFGPRSRFLYLPFFYLLSFFFSCLKLSLVRFPIYRICFFGQPEGPKPLYSFLGLSLCHATDKGRSFAGAIVSALT